MGSDRRAKSKCLEKMISGYKSPQNWGSAHHGVQSWGDTKLEKNPKLCAAKTLWSDGVVRTWLTWSVTRLVGLGNCQATASAAVS
jgi:hypothetical protein